MKRILLVLSIIFLYSQAFSQGKLTFFSQDGKKFWVIINGEKMNKEPQYNVKDIPVSFQWGKVRIIFEDEKIKPIDKNVQVVDVNNNWCNVKYMIKEKKGKYVINDFDATYEVISPVSVDQNTQQPVPQNTTTTTTTQPNTQNNQPNTQTTNTQTTGISQNTSISPTGITTTVTDPLTGQTITTGVNVQMGQTTQTLNQTTTVSSQSKQPANLTTVTQTPANQQQQANYVMPGYSGKIGCPWPMQQPDFEESKKSVASKNFEDSKLTVAKQIAGANCLLCSQVKEIMQLFNFEESKLDFAKFAYDHVYDVNNYYKLNDAFSFESTIEELNQYISTKK